MSYLTLLNSTTWWRNIRSPIQSMGQNTGNNNSDKYSLPAEGDLNKALTNRLGNEPEYNGQRMVFFEDSLVDLNKNKPALDIWEKDPQGYAGWINERLQALDVSFITSTRMPSLESRNLRATMLQRMLTIKSDNENFNCHSCGTSHPLNISYRPRRVIVTDSTLNLRHGDACNPFDLEHHEYMALPGYDVESITRFYFEAMKMDPSQQLIYALVGLNNVLKGCSFEDLVKSLEKFEAMVNVLDNLHGRTGANRSRVAFGTLPQIPKLLPIPKQGIHSPDQTWLTPGGAVILDGNHWIENYNLMAFPLQNVPKSHSNGWRSVRKNKSTLERVWSIRKDAWRSSEPRKDCSALLG